MKCPCGVDHWLHLALGFQGIVGMMAQLRTSECPPTAAAIEKFDLYLSRLGDEINKLKRSAACPTESRPASP